MLEISNDDSGQIVRVYLFVCYVTMIQKVRCRPE